MATYGDPVARDDRTPADHAPRRAVQLVLRGVGTLVIIVLVATGSIIWHLRQAATDDSEAAIRTFDLMLAEHTARVFEGADHVISEMLRRLQADGIGSATELRSRQSGIAVHDQLVLTMSGLPQVDSVFLVDRDGHTVNTSNPVTPSSLDISDRDYFVALRDHPELEPFVSAPTLDRVRGTHVVFMARRLSAPDGSFIGIVVVSIALGYFEDFFRDISPGDGRSFALFRDDGVLITRYPEDPRLLGRSVSVITAIAALATEREPHIVRIRGEINPIAFVIAGRRVPRFPLISTVAQTQAAIDETWASRAIVIAISGLATLLAIGLMGWLLLRQFRTTERLASMRGEIRSEREARRLVEQSEAQLRRSEEHLARAQELGSIGSFELDFKNGLLDWSAQAYRIYGLDPDQTQPTHERVLSLMEASDRERVINSQRRIAAGLDEGPIEYRIVRPDGTIRFVRRTAAPIRDELGAITGFMGTIQDITEIRQTEEALRQSESLFRQVAESIGEVFWLTDVAKSEVIFINAAYEKIWGRSCASLYAAPQSWMDAIHSDDRDRVRTAAMTPQAAGGYDIEYRIVRPDGAVRWIRDSAFPVKQAGGQVTCFAGVAEDITARRELEAQLRQAQKMEAIGNLTGGLAHDFNNLLGIIIGNLELLSGMIRREPPADEMYDDALQAALRGADLTRRLLAFARRQPLQPQLVQANELVSGIVKLLRRMLGERVRIELSLAADLWTVTVDPAQLEAAITNLATNARDAMPNGGLLAIATRNVSLDEAYVAAQPELQTGDFVVIEVADSGTGMPADILSQIFEPFFSTKEEGKGSGLGLSMVFGFIKQSGGHVTVYSEPGHGSSFKIYLPRAAGDASFEDSRVADPVPRGRAEMILVVEDNEAMRSVVVKQLGSLGYRVLEAENAVQARDIIVSDRPIDLLFTDIIMAGAMDGFALAEEAVRRRPDLKVLLTSGFPEKRFGVEAATGVERRLLSKPYRKDELARALREILDGLLP